MKIFRYGVWLAILLISLVATFQATSIQANVSPDAANPSPPAGYCTDYAMQRFSAPADKRWIGNANQYVTNAGKAGWNTSTTVTSAVPGALVVWNGGGYGHVAYVESKTSTGINITEWNWALVTKGKGHFYYGSGETNAQFSYRQNWTMTDNFGYNPGTVFLSFSSVSRRGTNSPYTFLGYVLPTRK